MEHLADWESYYHSERPDLLVQLAIIHAQFEIIHPFLDGNGRIGRILIPLFLFEKNLLTRPVFYLSSYLEANRDEYIERLRKLGRQKDSWTGWVEFFLLAITRQAEANVEAARKIIELYETLKPRVIALTRSQYAVPVLDVLFERPILSAGSFDRLPGLPGKTMIVRILSKLREGEILSIGRAQSGRRPQILIFDELLNLCESIHSVYR
jgi:Fic family protein